MNKIKFCAAEINLRLTGHTLVLQSQKCDHNQRRSEVSVVTGGVDTVQAALPRGHDQCPQSLLTDRLPVQVQHLEHLAEVIRWWVVGWHSLSVPVRGLLAEQ